jgi:molybdopterin-guanine dinucleotide biosynthesis protein A
MIGVVDAVVLAGGRASRLGGIDKTALGGPGDTLLDRALRATAGAAARVVVAGEEARRPVPGVAWATETPRYGGPVAALAAALALPGLHSTTVLLLAADLLRAEEAVPALLAAIDTGGTMDGWLAVDRDGRDQPLLAVYRRAPLEAALAALPGGPAGAPLRLLLGPLALARIPLDPSLLVDVDTAADARGAGFRFPA